MSDLSESEKVQTALEVLKLSLSTEDAIYKKAIEVLIKALS